jgi:hypothetical protein
MDAKQPDEYDLSPAKRSAEGAEGRSIQVGDARFGRFIFCPVETSAGQRQRSLKVVSSITIADEKCAFHSR